MPLLLLLFVNQVYKYVLAYKLIKLVNLPVVKIQRLFVYIHLFKNLKSKTRLYSPYDINPLNYKYSISPLSII